MFDFLKQMVKVCGHRALNRIKIAANTVGDVVTSRANLLDSGFGI